MNYFKHFWKCSIVRKHKQPDFSKDFILWFQEVNEVAVCRCLIKCCTIVYYCFPRHGELMVILSGQILWYRKGRGVICFRKIWALSVFISEFLDLCCLPCKRYHSWSSVRRELVLIIGGMILYSITYVHSSNFLWLRIFI